MGTRAAFKRSRHWISTLVLTWGGVRTQQSGQNLDPEEGSFLPFHGPCSFGLGLIHAQILLRVLLHGGAADCLTVGRGEPGTGGEGLWVPRRAVLKKNYNRPQLVQ